MKQFMVSRYDWNGPAGGFVIVAHDAQQAERIAAQIDGSDWALWSAIPLEEVAA